MSLWLFGRRCLLARWNKKPDDYLASTKLASISL